MEHHTDWVRKWAAYRAARFLIEQHTKFGKYANMATSIPKDRKITKNGD
jgi:hypothetical protein